MNLGHMNRVHLNRSHTGSYYLIWVVQIFKNFQQSESGSLCMRLVHNTGYSGS